jgi:hypothetical protein
MDSSEILYEQNLDHYKVEQVKRITGYLHYKSNLQLYPSVLQGFYPALIEVPLVFLLYKCTK